LFLELKLEDFIHEWIQSAAFRTFTDSFSGQGVLEILDSEEFFLLPARLLLVILLLIVLQEGKITINKIEHEIAEGDKIISPAMCLHVECVLGGEDQVTLEHFLFLQWYMFAIFLDVLHYKSKIDESNLVS
jgi:hypothetical protein